MFSASYHMIMISCIQVLALLMTFSILSVVANIGCDAVRLEVSGGYTIRIWALSNKWDLFVVFSIFLYIFLFFYFYIYIYFFFIIIIYLLTNPMEYLLNVFHGEGIITCDCRDIGKTFFIID